MGHLVTRVVTECHWSDIWCHDMPCPSAHNLLRWISCWTQCATLLHLSIPRLIVVMEIASQAGRQNPPFNLYSCLSLGRVLHTRTILKLAQHLQKAQLKSWQRHCSELLFKCCPLVQKGANRRVPQRCQQTNALFRIFEEKKRGALPQCFRMLHDASMKLTWMAHATLC